MKEIGRKGATKGWREGKSEVGRKGPSREGRRERAFLIIDFCKNGVEVIEKKFFLGSELFQMNANNSNTSFF